LYTRQSDNVVGGDNAGRDVIKNSTYNIINSPSSDELALLYAKLKVDGVGEPANSGFSHKLLHYMAVPTDGDVRGLEEKLKSSNRLDMLNFAIQQKETAAKLIMKYQSSRSAQRVFTIILDELHTIYMLTVTPIIEKDGDRQSVDASINQALFTIKSMLGENFLEFTVKDLLGLLFFLAGNCHIRWDKNADIPPSI
jgi:hypothetical protein